MTVPSAELKAQEIFIGQVIDFPTETIRFDQCLRKLPYLHKDQNIYPSSEANFQYLEWIGKYWFLLSELLYLRCSYSISILKQEK